MKYIIGNWKAHFTVSQADSFLNQFLGLYSTADNNSVTVIICPPFHLLAHMHTRLQNYKIALGAQYVSQFGEGRYTGEIPAASISSLITYTIIGHSERRKYNHETQDILDLQTQQATSNSIKPIYCIEHATDSIPSDISILVYEPSSSIGSSNTQNHPKSLAEILEFKKTLSSKPTTFIYGGSIRPENAKSYLQSSEIDGLLIGDMSLDPNIFYSIIQQASS